VYILRVGAIERQKTGVEYAEVNGVTLGLSQDGNGMLLVLCWENPIKIVLETPSYRPDWETSTAPARSHGPRIDNKTPITIESRKYVAARFVRENLKVIGSAEKVSVCPNSETIIVGMVRFWDSTYVRAGDE
jgi:hypothetical protein